MDATVPFEELHPCACVGFKRAKLGKIERVPNLTRHWLTVCHCFPPYAFKSGIGNGEVGFLERRVEPKNGSGSVTANPEGAAKLAVNPAEEGTASRTCPVATVVIPGGRRSDLPCRKLRSKNPSRQSASGVGSVRGASKSAGCSESSEPLAAERRSHR
jgi:hypothetical protein